MNIISFVIVNGMGKNIDYRWVNGYGCDLIKCL